MPVSAATLKKLMAAGLSGEALLDVVESIDADCTPAKSRSAHALRQERYRDRKASQSVTSDASRVSPKEIPPTPPKEITPSKPEDKPKPEVGFGKKLAKRLPIDFEPDIEWAVSQGLSRSQAIIEAAKFRDYWSAKGGVNATKLDWPATWRNWVRQALERTPQARGSPDAFRPKPNSLQAAIERRQETRNADEPTRSFAGAAVLLLRDGTGR